MDSERLGCRLPAHGPGHVSGRVALELLGAGALAASVAAVALVGACASRRGDRLTSLVRPLHELRGALTGLQLGLFALERSRSTHRVAWPEVQLERARLALGDLDACLEGRAHGDELARAESVDLKALVLRSARAWSQLAPGRGTQVRVCWRAGTVGVEGHAGRLAQAIENLVANAVEHGRGHVLIEGTLADGRVRVAVVDGGPGVSPPAQRGEAPARAPRGHGLAITRDVIAAHKGKLLFERR